MSLATNLTGHTLGGYQLIEQVGRGAMATVYKAYQPTLERWVAVKVLYYKETTALARFRREAKAIALLRHRNILIVYEYGEEGEWPYIVMEYVPGGALSEQLTGQPLNWPKAINLILPVADALHYAHGRGIIHRDVKPSNILLPQPDWPLLADFGLVKLPSAGEGLTRSGASMGTPAYVAPEQARGESVDHRADIYSLGVILFEMVTGRLPFDYPNPNRVLLAHISEPPPEIHALNPTCPPDLVEIVRTALKKAPGERYSSLNQMMDALQALMSSASARAALQAPAPPPRPSSPTPEPPSSSAPAPPQRPPKRERQDTQLIDTNPGEHNLAALQARFKQADSVPETPAPPQAKILVPDKNVTLPVPDQETVIIGRTHRDTVADLDLGPYGAAQVGVSRRHARLTRRANRWLIEDMGSLNGTFVNDSRLQPHNPVPLNNGDVIRCSRLTFIFLISS